MFRRDCGVVENDPPIEEVMDDIVPDWRAIARRMKREGSTDLEIVAEIRTRMNEEIDRLLDTYNSIGAGA